MTCGVRWGADLIVRLPSRTTVVAVLLAIATIALVVFSRPGSDTPESDRAARQLPLRGLSPAASIPVSAAVPAEALERRTVPPDTRRARPQIPPASLRPPALREGDTIALVAPAGAVSALRLRQATANLEKLGYRVKLFRDLSVRDGYLAGSDLQRASEINRAFEDPEVSMILCVRGGYGSPRIVQLLDYDAIRNNPKIFVGFSDITALLTAIRQRTGLVVFHGPMAEKDFSGRHGLAPFSSRHLWTLLSGTEQPGDSPLLADWGARASPKLGERRTIVPGVAVGPLVGGNLSTIVALMGTPHELVTDGAILFIEDVNEEPFRIDRMLCQLALAGKLSALRGALIGSFTRCVPRDPKSSFSTAEVIEHFFGDLGIPVLAGFPAGHLPDQATLPLGCRVRLDATGKTVAIIDSPVTAR